MASKCISKLGRLRPPSSHHHGLQVHLQTRTITASKCISKLAQAHPPSVSLNSLDLSLQVYLQTRTISASKCMSKLDYGRQTCSITASVCISKFTASRCGETMELDGRQAIINTAPHLAWYSNGERVGKSGSSSRSVGRG